MMPGSEFVNDRENSLPPPSVPRYRRSDVVKVKQEIAIHMEMCTRAWIGYGEGRVVIIKDDSKGLITYHVYEEGSFTFYDGRGGSQVVAIEEITEIAGF